MSQQHFLIVFDGSQSRMKESLRTFDAVSDALDAYRQAEQRYENDRDIQVVLISADSLDTVKTTHPNFWTTLDFRELALEALKP